LTDPDLEAGIRERARACGIELIDEAVHALATHARAVLKANADLHLTTISDPAEFLERHLGEAFEGAALLPEGTEGLLLDLGSGNGYPGIPIVAARPDLRGLLTDASKRRAAFLRSAIRIASLQSVDVLERQVQRPLDLEGVDRVQVLTTRAMGGWPKVIPRLVPALAPQAKVLVWAGEEMEQIAQRVAWRKLQQIERRPLPGREQSWIWVFSLPT
jgi:16S rRNA (guanine527-N7)-methyltransferase